jgi:hypothetical protein
VHYRDLSQVLLAGDGDKCLHLEQQDTYDVFKTPESGDLILVTEVEAGPQTRGRLSRESRKAGDRMKKGTIAGRIEQAERPFTMEAIAPAPTASHVTGAVPNGHKALKALVGAYAEADAFTAEDIASVVSHSRAATVINVDRDAADFTVGHVYALISNNTGSSRAAYQQRLLGTIANQGGAGAGGVDLTFVGGFSAKPIVTGTADQIQGCGVYTPPASGDTWTQRFCGIVADGWMGEEFLDAVAASGTITMDAESILKIAVTLQARKTLKASRAHVLGTGSADTFTTSEASIKVDDASKFDVGAVVDLERYTVASGVGTYVSTETGAVITAKNLSTNVLTLDRGATAVAANTSQGLTATTTGTQERNGTYNTATKNKLRLTFDRQKFLDVTLTAGGTTSAATIVADINAAFALSEKYGHMTDAPFSGSPTAGVVFDSVAVVTGTAVRLTSPGWGVGSHIKNEAYPTSAVSAHDVIFQAAFELEAGEEIQMFVRDPGGTEVRKPAFAGDHFCSCNGFEVHGASFECAVDNQPEWLAPKHRDAYPKSVRPGVERNVTAQITVPAYAWTNRIATQIANDDALVWNYQAGPWGFHMRSSKHGELSKSGQEVSFTATAEDPGVTGITEFAISFGPWA